jgi:hypothetical protein
MEQPSVITRLHVLRRTVRLRLLVYGASAVAMGGILSFLTIVAFDWLLWLPSLLRIVAAALFVGGFLGATWYWLVKPLRARIGIDEIAGRLERHFGNLHDRLSSTVNFLDRGDAGSSQMMQQVVAKTEQITRDMPLESVLSLRPLLLRCASLMLSVAVLCAILLVDPYWIRSGFDRYVYPFGDTEWPRTVSIVPLTGDETVAVGESVTVRMKIERGLDEALRGVVHLREPDGSTIALTMQREQDTVFYTTIDAVTEELTYWFEAGDDSTRSDPSTIRAVHRPAVLEALAVVEPPPYAARRTTRVQDLSDGAVKAPVAGYVTVAVRSTKPIPSVETGSVTGLRCESGELIPLAVDPEDSYAASTRLKVTGDTHFRIELRDEEGFENRGAVRHSILAVPDGPPVVTILEPKAVTELTPTGSVRLVIRVEDDFGVTRLDLNAERLGTTDTHSVSLTARLAAVDESEGAEAVAEYLWSVETLSLSPGDQLVYRVSATDNCTAQEETGQVGLSTPMRIKIISDVEFDIRLRDDLALLEARIREAALDQVDILDLTTELLQTGAEHAPLSEAQREAVASAAAREARLVRRLRDLSRRFLDITRRMEQNHAGDEEARRQVASLGDNLLQIAAGPMTSAGTRLSEARELASAEDQQDALQAAARHEEAAADRLQALIHTMAQWGSFRGLVTKTRDLLDRQSALRTRTIELGKSMLGKPVESLTAEEAAALIRLLREQGQLGVDVDNLLERMTRLSTAAKDKDPSGADAMDAALRAAGAHDLTRHLRGSVRAIESNRTAAAVMDQKRAEAAFKKMLDALKERESRELEQLRKYLQRADEQVAHLIEEQQALRSATEEAGLMGADAETFGALEQQQRLLRRNTKLVSEDLAQLRRTAPAARVIRQAVHPMGTAETELQKLRADTANTAQDEAIELLKDAQARLEELAREAEELALQRSLAQIHDDLEEILAAQITVNGRIGKLKGAVEARERVSRAEAREASKLSREQAQVRRMIDEVLPDFEQVIVYMWALTRVGDWMDASRSRLNDRRIDDELVDLTDRITRELKKLIQAIVETRAMPLTTEFVEAEGGGGGGAGHVMQTKPVPTVAELLVLRSMQGDINERTQELHQSLDLQNATEQQLRKLEEIGEDQTEVRRLTEMVTGRVRQP